MNNTKSSTAVLTEILSSRSLKRVAIVTVAATFLTIFILAACSAPQNGNAPANSAQTQSAQIGSR
jgi:hypothetical protein